MMRKRKFIKILSAILLIFVLLWWSIYFIIRKPSVQTYLVNKATDYLSSKLNTEVSISGVNFEFFKIFIFENVLVKDQNNDTLLFAEQLKVDFNLLSWRKNIYKIEYAGLNNCLINLVRKKGNEDFNYQFISDYFSPIDSVNAPPSKKKKESSIELAISEIRFEKINFLYRDEKREEQMKLHLNEFVLNTKETDGRKKIFHINTIHAKKAFFSYSNLKGNYRSPKSDTIPFVHINQGQWKIFADRIMIEESEFEYVNENYFSDTSFGMDYQHLSIQNIDLQIKDVKILQDTIWGSIHLSAKEKSGFILNKLIADFKVTPIKSELNNLQILTPFSRVENYFAIKYQTLYYLSDFVAHVKMQGDFINSKISFKDLVYFAPTLRDLDLNQTVLFSGQVNGEVGKLKGDNIKIQFGNNSYFNGNISFRGLPDIDATFIDLKINNFQSNQNDIALFIPHQVPRNLFRFGNIKFTGRFTGFTNDFVANGEFYTGIGNLTSDLNMKINQQTSRTIYSGQLNADSFNIGKWLGVEKLGIISGNSKITGSGLKLENLSTKLTAKINQMEFNKYIYTGITLDGEFEKKLFKGQLLTKDPNIHLDFSGTIDFNHPLPLFDFQSSVKNARLKQLNFTPDDYTFSTNLKIDLTGNNIDNMSGDIRIRNTFITKSDTVENILQKHNLDSLILTARGQHPSRNITLQSNLMNASLKGDFHTDELISAFSHYIKTYVPSSPIIDTSLLENQDFTFDMNINDTTGFIHFLLPSFNKFEKANIVAKFNTEQKKLDLQVNVPEFIYEKILFYNFKMIAASHQEQLITKTTVESIKINDSSHIEHILLTGTLSKDSIYFNLKGNDTFPTHIHLDGLAIFEKQQMSLKILNSTIYLNNKIWDIPPTNSFLVTSTGIIANDFVVQQNEQKISLNSIYNTDSSRSFKLQINQLDLAEFSKALKYHDFSFEGKADGAVQVFDLSDGIFISDITVRNFMVDKILLGTLTLNAKKPDTTSRYYVNSDLKMDDEFIGLNGTMEMKVRDSTTGKFSNILNFKVSLKNYQLKIAELFLSRDISATHGTADGNILLSGTIQKPLITGKIKLNNAGTTLNYLNTHYTLNNEEAVLEKDKIVFNNFTLYDEQHNKASLNGYLSHNHLNNFGMNINIKSDNFQFLNTTVKDNELYYGICYAKAHIQIGGTFENTEMNVAAKTNAGSNLTIPITSTKDYYKPDFVSFVKKNAVDTVSAHYKVDLNGIKMNFEMEVTPEAQMQILLQENVGGIIQGKGNARLKMEISSLGDFNMYGIYNIEDGDYLFTWRNPLISINKKFKVDRGGTITWYGNPYDAQLNMTAVYQLRASTYDLIAGITEDANEQKAAKTRTPVNLNLKLSASLFAPNVDFKISIPPENTAPYIGLVIQRIQEFEKPELDRQVAALLLINKFIPPLGAGNFGVGIAAIEGAKTTGSEIGSSILSGTISELVSKNITDLDINVGYKSYQDGVVAGEEFTFAASKQFKRWIIDVGGAKSSSVTSSGNLTGNFTVYRLNTNGAKRFKIFGKSEEDILAERNKNKTGIGYFYGKEYDHISDLWKSYRKKYREEENKKN